MNFLLFTLSLLLSCSAAQAFVFGSGGGMAAPSGFSLPLDPDAAAFLVAAGINDATQKNAVSDLVIALKAANIWTKFKAIYPVVGGTATTHKFNLKDPADLDASYRLTFSGAWTHANTGMVAAATTSYADSHLVPSATLNKDSNHVSFYIRTNTDTGLPDRYNIGAYSGGGIGIATYNSNSLYAFANHTGTNVGSSASLVTTGFWLLSRTASDSWALFNPAGTKIGTGTQVAAGNISIPLYVGALNFNGDRSATGQETSFASIGDGLSDSEVALLGSAVAAFETALGR